MADKELDSVHAQIKVDPSVNMANIRRQEIEFRNSYDHINHQGHGLSLDADQVQLTVVKDVSASAHQCQADDFAVVHWKGYENDTMKFVQDSRVVRKGKPAYYRIGAYQVSKCWDIAFQQMKEGQTVKVFCPASVDKGGAPNQYHHWGTGWTQTGTNMLYVLEMVECSPSPKFF